MSDIEKKLDELGHTGAQRRAMKKKLFQELRHKLWVLRGSPTSEQEAAMHKEAWSKVELEHATRDPTKPLN